MQTRLKTALLFAALLGVGFTSVDTVQASEVSKAKSSTKHKVRVEAPKAKAEAQSKKKVSLHAARKKIVSVQGASSVPQWQEARRLDVQSAAALVFDQNAGDALYQKNASQVVPIASITKLMTAMVVLDSSPSLSAPISISEDDVDTLRGSRSRLHVGAVMPRENALLLALMSSENRAAASLAHHYPGGYDAFIRAMNAKAQALGMTHTRYVEPTGLSVHNVSTARDLTKLLIASEQYPLIGQLSTTKEETATFAHPAYSLPFRNTNHLVYRDNWNIQLTKTGFTNAAGHCLIMRTVINQRPVALVVMDAFGKYTHFADASRLRTWIETGKVMPVPASALSYKKQREAQMAEAMLKGGAQTAQND